MAKEKATPEPTPRQADLEPTDEVRQIITEATAQVEEELRLEDEGWYNISGRQIDVITYMDRINNLKLSRLYYYKDPLGRQAVRLWTDYTFGAGMTWQTECEKAQKILSGFWDSRDNQSCLSARGQRKSSDRLLVDGEVFFAIFLGTKEEAKIRRIDPLEITEIITEKDDIEDIKYFRRQWSDRMGKLHEDIYRSTTNIKGEPCPDQYGKTIEKPTSDALVYHLPYNTISQRGNPLLLPALDWMKQYRRFLASRIAIMLALARFAWKSKLQGGQTAVDAVKAKTHEQEILAATHLIENMGVDTTPIKTDTGARNAYQDGRMIKLQIAAAVGIPEQYFGDISIGNLATAKTVELPMMKMFQSYQKVWADAYQDIDEVVLEHGKVPPDKWYVDRDFPTIAPADVAQIALSLKEIITIMPEFAYSPEVQQIALMALGINNPSEVLDALAQESKTNPDVKLVKALKAFRESIANKEPAEQEERSE